MVYIICECHGMGLINEIQFYDNNDNLITFDTTSFDIYPTNAPYEWNGSDYKRENLNNSAYLLYDAVSGRANCTNINNNPVVNITTFLIKLNSDNIYNLKKIVVWMGDSIGDSTQRNLNVIYFYYYKNLSDYITSDLQSNYLNKSKTLGSINTSYAVKPETAFYINVILNKFIIQDGNNLNITDGTDLSTKGSLPYTKDIFATYGMNDLSNINSSVISYINNNKYNITMLK